MYVFNWSRSTIVGNFVANVNEAVGHRVTRLNWLGDFGTQFGLLAAGLQRSGTDVHVIAKQPDPVQELNEIYVLANAEAESNEEFSKLARKLFSDLERGDSELRRQWSVIRELTVRALDEVYDRLNVRFDATDGEAMYSGKPVVEALATMEAKGLLRRTDDGKTVIDLGDGKVTTVVKSDGSSLYLTRDFAAAVDRANRYPDMDRMLYVVEVGQQEHFSWLFRVLRAAGFDWAHRLQHVAFGRIGGMSTRRGTAVFLSDILDEARDRMRAQQEASPNTRDASDEATDVLATTAVVVNDFKQGGRKRNFEFSWEAALASKGNGGVRLQYSHSRLCSLLENNGVAGADIENADYWKERLSRDLACLSEYDEAVTLIYQASYYLQSI